MNVVFFHVNGIRPQAGGISRITHSLTEIFRKNNINVFLIGVKDTVKGESYDKSQFFLPDSCKIDSSVNVLYLKHFIEKNSIDVIINQTGLYEKGISLLEKVKKEATISVVTCFHNSLLTPVYNLPYQLEYELKEKRLDILFSILKKKAIRRVLVNLYITLNRRKLQYVITNSDAVVTLCNGLKDELLRVLKTTGSEKIKVISNCIESHIECVNSTNKKNTVLWVGTTDFKVKRLDLMLKIWENIYSDFPEWTLKILGDGDKLSAAKKLSEKIGLKNVSFEGRVNPFKYYEEAEIICITSTHESFSLVCVEGMFHKVVPIAFNSYPAALEILDNGRCGQLIPPFDIMEYCNQLKELMKRRDYRDDLRKNAKINIVKYTPSVIFKQWEKLFAEIKK